MYHTINTLCQLVNILQTMQTISLNLNAGFHTGFWAWGEKSIGASTKRGNVRGLGISPLPGLPRKF